MIRLATASQRGKRSAAKSTHLDFHLLLANANPPCVAASQMYYLASPLYYSHPAPAAAALSRSAVNSPNATAYGIAALAAARLAEVNATIAATLDITLPPPAAIPGGTLDDRVNCTGTSGGPQQQQQPDRTGMGDAGGNLTLRQLLNDFALSMGAPSAILATGALCRACWLLLPNFTDPVLQSRRVDYALARLPDGNNATAYLTCRLPQRGPQYLGQCVPRAQACTATSNASAPFVCQPPANATNARSASQPATTSSTDTYLQCSTPSNCVLVPRNGVGLATAAYRTTCEVPCTHYQDCDALCYCATACNASQVTHLTMCLGIDLSLLTAVCWRTPWLQT